MAYGSITGYEPTETPGAYRFMDKSGSPWLLSGGPAEALKARLDAAAAVAPQPTAGLNPHGTTRPPVATDAPAPVPGAAPAAPRQGVTTVSEPTDEQGRTVDQRRAANSPMPGFESVGPGIYKGADGRYYEYRAGSAGSKGGLVLRGETRQGVQDLDPEFMAEQAKLAEERTGALQATQEAQLEQAKLEAEHRAEMERVAVNEAAEAQKREAEVNKQVGELEQKYEKTEKDIANSKIDSSMGWLEVLAIGLGTAGAVIGKHENFALNIVQRNVDRRIAAQEHAINVKRETKNDLAKMLEVTKGDRKLARAALDAAYTRKAQAVFETRAAQTGDKLLKAQHQQQAIELRDSYLLKRKMWTDAAKGEVTQSYVNTPARAATKGGLAPMGDQLGTEARLLANQGAAAKNATTAAAAAPGKVDSATAKQVAGLDAGIAAIDRLMQKHAERKFAGGGVTGGALDEGDAQWAADVDAAVPLIDAAKQGGAPNESTMGDMKGALKSARGSKIATGLMAEKQILQDRKRALLQASGAAAPAEEPTE